MKISYWKKVFLLGWVALFGSNPLIVLAGGEGAALANLTDYYRKEKAYWDNYIESNCPKDKFDANCNTARKMQDTYIYLITDLIRDKSINRLRTSQSEKPVYEVPVRPDSPEETAGLTNPDPPAENIP